MLAVVLPHTFVLGYLYTLYRGPLWRADRRVLAYCGFACSGHCACAKNDSEFSSGREMDRDALSVPAK